MQALFEDLVTIRCNRCPGLSGDEGAWNEGLAEFKVGVSWQGRTFWLDQRNPAARQIKQ